MDNNIVLLMAIEAMKTNSELIISAIADKQSSPRAEKRTLQVVALQKNENDGRISILGFYRGGFTESLPSKDGKMPYRRFYLDTIVEAGLGELCEALPPEEKKAPKPPFINILTAWELCPPKPAKMTMEQAIEALDAKALTAMTVAIGPVVVEVGKNDNGSFLTLNGEVFCQKSDAAATKFVAAQFLEMIGGFVEGISQKIKESASAAMLKEAEQKDE